MRQFFVPGSVLLAIAICGCGRVESGAAPRGLLIGGDRSGSAERFAKQTVATIDELCGSFHGPTLVFRYGADVREAMGPTLPANADERLSKLIEVFLPPSRKSGTDPGKFLTACALRGPELGSFDVVCITDGGDDTGPDSSSLEAGAKALAAARGFGRLILVGVVPGLREHLREKLAPLGGKIVFTEFSGAVDALEN
jgi:hypothetical protein